mgnify:CR=1 FL=1
MERFVVGDVVVMNYRYSDCSGYKRRPALVLSTPIDENIIVCQITTRLYADPFVVSLNEKDFNLGALKESSFIRPNKMGTYDLKSIHYKIGELNMNKIKEMGAMLKKILPIY